MKSYEVVLAPEFLVQLQELRRYIAEQSSPRIANGYIDRIAAKCATLSTAPFRGTARDDLRPGLRTIPFERRATLGFDVEEATVTVLAIAYGGRDLGGLLD